jgi:xylulokinase
MTLENTVQTALKAGPFYLGIDIGTSSVKAMLVDSRGLSRGSAGSEYPSRYPGPGQVEQDPEDWYRGAAEAVRRLLAESGVAPGEVAGIGICGTSHAPILLDRRKRVLRPAILWSDQRSGREVEELKAEGEKEIHDTAWNGINCTWTLPQLLWVGRHEPETYGKVRHLLISKDYLVYRLSGRMVTDFSSAVSTLMVDAGKGIWSGKLLGRAGLGLGIVPEILAPADLAGTLTAEAARDFSLSRTTLVAAGFIDSAAEMVGLGALDESVGVIRLGNAGGVMTVKRRGGYRKNCLAYPHPVAPCWYYQAGTNACTTSLLWARNLFAKNGRGLSYPRIDSLSRQAPLGSGGLLFHPYLLGERAPYWEPALRGGFNGLSPSHGKAHVFRAVQEGVAFSLRDCLAEVDWTGVSEARICGGGAKSNFWSEVIADVFGLPVVRMRYDDASAYGAALLAAAAVSGEKIEDIAGRWVRRRDRLEPNAARHEAYRGIYEGYRTLAQGLLNFYR